MHEKPDERHTIAVLFDVLAVREPSWRVSAAAVSMIDGYVDQQIYLCGGESLFSVQAQATIGQGTKT